MASLLGKMPTTLVRRLISPLTRSIGFVECSLSRCCVSGGWRPRFSFWADYGTPFA
jgi:hypothetical protein